MCMYKSFVVLLYDLHISRLKQSSINDPSNILPYKFLPKNLYRQKKN